jgi:hypothetical protein
MSPRQRVEHAIITIRAFAGTRFAAFVGLIGGAALGAGVAVAAWPPAQVAPTATGQTSPVAARPCDQQTWPYLDASCLKAGAGRARQVRLLSTDRDVPGTLRTVTVSGNAVANVTTATTAPQAKAAVVATSATPAAQSAAAKPPTSTERSTARRSVTVHYGRKFASREGRHAQRWQYRVAGPIDIAPGRDAVAMDRRWNDTSRRAMAYGDDAYPAPRTVLVPREGPFSRPPFFSR